MRVFERLVAGDGDVDAAVGAELAASRRDVLRRGLALGGGALAASTIPTLLRTRDAFAAANSDGAIVAAAVGLEQTAVFAYDTAIAGDLLDARTHAVLRHFRDQEQEHADALKSALGGLGAKAPAKPRRPADVHGLSGLKSQHDVLRFAVALETMAVAAYYDAHRRLRDARLLQTAASIMANEGQHLVVLRQALGDEPVPSAFATGGKASP